MSHPSPRFHRLSTCQITSLSFCGWQSSCSCKNVHMCVSNVEVSRMWWFCNKLLEHQCHEQAFSSLHDRFLEVTGPSFKLDVTSGIIDITHWQLVCSFYHGYASLRMHWKLKFSFSGCNKSLHSRIRSWNNPLKIPRFDTADECWEQTRERRT